MDKHVALLRHLILNLSQPVFVVSPLCCMLREIENTILIVFGFTRLGLKSTIYHTRHDTNHNNTDVVLTRDLTVYDIQTWHFKWFTPVTRMSWHSNIDKYIINYKPDILNGLPVTRRSWHSNIDKYIINYKPDILNGLSKSHVGLGILTLINIS